MAIPTPVNGQITDSVTQSAVSVLGSAPANAMGAIYQSAAHSTSILFQNAVQAQQQASMCSQAATNQGVMQLYSVNTMAGAQATAKLGQSDNSDALLTLLVILAATRR
ncbi:RebB family R body protein [Thalassospira sp. ER-Se-21-Dark]|uniref:RebB family R body protein n=1 Tax=Thalassospira sp. ER-Se-21-Dark TaxID=2585190 RepID=UPI001B30F2D8|nr:RebB family R body protein [Thalassospira sp. ER-Se-21-Dark]MBP3127408.1 RebB like protein [Thalassospira sp. ER-Se-21-Dark]